MQRYTYRSFALVMYWLRASLYAFIIVGSFDSAPQSLYKSS